MSARRKAIQERFVQSVRSGLKVSTIRPTPKRSCDFPEAGDSITLFRWTGKPYRSPQEEVLVGRIRRVWHVTVSELGVRLEDGATYWMAHAPGGDREAIAKREGFTDWSEMAEWFRCTHGLPFDGIMIEWDPR
jgi:hypothetical protein